MGSSHLSVLVSISFSNILEGREKERTQLANHAVQGVVLLVVVVERQDVDEDGKNLLDGNVLTVAEDHTAQTASGVVLESGDVHLQAVLQSREDGRELLDDSGIVGVLDQTSNGISSIGLGLRVLITQTVNQELEEGRRELGDSRTHAVDALGQNTNSGSTLERLAAAGVAKDGLLEDLPELSEALSQGGSHARDDVEGGVNDNPVELGSLLGSSDLILAKLDLARVLLVDDVGDHLNDVVQSGLAGDERRTAVAEVLGHVAVDVGDGCPRFQRLEI